MWHTHWVFLKTALIQGVQFRTELLVYLFTQLFPLGIMLVVWASVFQGGYTYQGFSLSSIITYSLLATLMRTLTNSGFEEYRIRQIREGKIDYYLSRPYAYFYEVLWREVASNIIITTLSLICMAGLLGWAWQAGTISQNIPSAPELLIVVALLGYAFWVEFLLSYLIVLLGFWLESAEGLQHFKWMCVTVLGGSFLPVEFMPSWLQHVVYLLPFHYMYRTPILIWLGQPVPWQHLLYPVVFLLVLATFTQVMWRLAIKQYASAG